MKKKVRILSLFLTALMVTGLCGCGSTDNSIDNTAPQNSTVVNDQNIEADKETAEASTTVTPAQAKDQVSGFDKKLSSACPDATISEGLAIRGNDCHDASSYGIFFDRRIVS